MRDRSHYRDIIHARSQLENIANMMKDISPASIWDGESPESYEAAIRAVDEMWKAHRVAWNASQTAWSKC